MYFPNGFSKDLAIELGELINCAYKQYDSFENGEKWDLPKPYELIDTFQYEVKANTIMGMEIPNYEKIRKFLHVKEKEKIFIPMGFIAQNKNRAFIVFRGTKTPKEWISNLTINLEEYPISSYGKVHEGFLEVYNSIKETISKNLTRIHDKKKLYVTGHSLGAALATLSLPDLEINHSQYVDALYTFGSPRVGDDAFVKQFDSIFRDRSFRVANTSDVVTSIPLPIPIIGSIGGYFSHVDVPVDFTFQGNDIVINHDMNTYIEKLKVEKPKKGLLRLIFK
jgi:predicted lipase